MTPPIPTERLDLVSLTPEFLDTTLAGESREAARLLGARLPDVWPSLADTQRVFLERLRADAALAAWSLRAIVLRAEHLMVGHVGFHDAPTPDGVELTYTVFAPFRRRGYAREACLTLIDWAQREHGVERFVVSIAPANAPSLAVARMLGFRRIREAVDEVDRPEHVFELRAGALR